MTYSEAVAEIYRIKKKPWRTRTKEDWDALENAQSAFGRDFGVVECKDCRHNGCPVRTGYAMMDCKFYEEGEPDEETD